MDVFKDDLIKFFKDQFEFEHQQVFTWKNVIERARCILTFQNFDEYYDDICEAVKLAIFSNEDLHIGFNKHTMLLDKSLIKKRKAILRKYNNATKKISQLKKQLVSGITSDDSSDETNEGLPVQTPKTSRQVDSIRAPVKSSILIDNLDISRLADHIPDSYSPHFNSSANSVHGANDDDDVKTATATMLKCNTNNKSSDGQEDDAVKVCRS
jgi:hypothetical protein